MHVDSVRACSRGLAFGLCVWMLFLDNYSYFDHRVLNNEIDELENNKKYYQEEIKKDEENIKLLKNPTQIEKYAREKYFMKKNNEDVFVFDTFVFNRKIPHL